MSKMFKIDGKVMKTWNPFTGCEFDCKYCWVDGVIAKLLRMGNTAYKACGKAPTFHPERLKAKFRPGDTVFVSDMGDISFASWSEIGEIIDVISAHPQTDFLFMTKSPGIYTAGFYWPSNVIQGTTIETNRYMIDYSKAPPPAARFGAMMPGGPNHHPRKLISIEPIMDFDVDFFASLLVAVKPEIIQIGADNYNNGLPEPEGNKVIELIDTLREAGIRVEIKEGLKRITTL